MKHLHHGPYTISLSENNMNLFSIFKKKTLSNTTISDNDTTIIVNQETIDKVLKEETEKEKTAYDKFLEEENKLKNEPYEDVIDGEYFKYERNNKITRILLNSIAGWTLATSPSEFKVYKTTHGFSQNKAFKIDNPQHFNYIYGYESFELIYEYKKTPYAQMEFIDEIHKQHSKATLTIHCISGDITFNINYYHANAIHQSLINNLTD